MAKGENAGRSQGKVTVTFGWDLLDKINKDAKANGLSFAAQVRLICNQHYRRKEDV